MNSDLIGIITFHNSHNCGSMLQTFALQYYLEHRGKACEIIDFSNEGQQKLYGVFQKNDSIKNIIKNFIVFLYKNRIKNNYESYENFKNMYFHLSEKKYEKMNELGDERYHTVISGSDQVWNITIDDADDAYFLPWVKNAKKVAYAPSFGARNILKYSSEPEKYKDFLKDFNYISIREKNGKKWLHELLGIDVPVLIDPTLLLSAGVYDTIASTTLELPEEYIFYYSPGYQRKINKLVKAISNKYNLPVIAFNSKTFFFKGMQLSGFKLPSKENPQIYLQLIKNASLVITTSFHGTVFSSIYRRKFWTVKNGGMFGEDDRVATLMELLDLNDRMIPIKFDNTFDYLREKNYEQYSVRLKSEQVKAAEYLEKALG